MADFLDSEAEESEEEQGLNEPERKRAKKLKALDSDDEEDEEDDEERIREELKDLIDDNPIDEDESDDDGGDSDVGSKKRKKSDDEDEYDDRLEDDDYELLEENLGVKMERRKQFKRLRRIEEEESDDDQADNNEGDVRDAIANELFDHSDNEEDRSSDRITQQRSEADRYDEEGSEGEYSDADDFIVDDDGRPIAEKRKRKKPIFTDAALQEAQDIFGVDFDYDEFSKYDEYEEESEEEDDEYIDEEEGEEGRKRRQKKAARKKPSRKSIFEIYEPSELKRGHFTDVDNEIRSTDMPERMQLRSVPVTKVSKDLPELEEEAEWIYKQAFCRPTISKQEGFVHMDEKEPLKPPHTVGKIKQALDFMRNENFEVPFIAFYRKEYVQPELNINDLWKVYKFDEKWCQLKTRKTNLTRLFEKMRDYQAEELMKHIDQPIADNVRVIKDEDIERLRKVQSMEELRDIYQHFMLYYSHDLPAMQEACRRKERAEAKEKRRQEKLARRMERGEGEEGDEDVVEEEPEEDDAEELEQENETLKQASRGGTYALCRRAGLDGLAKKFGLSPEQFAENLRDNYQRNEVQQEPTEPSAVADEFKSNIFQTTEDVLMAAKFMVAIQLSREPIVRFCIRENYFERAKINIKPTKKGLKEIDENHPCYSGDQFLKLHTAEQERLIVLTFSEDVQGATHSSYIEEIKQLYIRP
ncbi:hypothetical protein B566_EDAN003489 [Ephemera danica]|nr:hypothetical protein B566_EDAN003489 [Ephemera danica]